jgi:DNA-binding MarR family transcriptional regulator
MSDPERDAREFAELFPAIYLRFHRRTKKRAGLTAQSSAVLSHLMHSGPLTITEAARHMNRAQSVMSEIVSGLEHKGLLERMTDDRDRRRTLVWLTPAGHAAMAEERQVLSLDLLCGAMARVPAEERRRLIAGMRALVNAVDRTTSNKEKKR